MTEVDHNKNDIQNLRPRNSTSLRTWTPESVRAADGKGDDHKYVDRAGNEARALFVRADFSFLGWNGVMTAAEPWSGVCHHRDLEMWWL